MAAVVTAAIIVAVVDNQSATRSINNRVGTNPTSFHDLAERSLLTFQWRFTPQSGVPAQHLWGAQFAGIATFLLLTFLLVWVVARGSAGFWQTFIGVWLSVIAATVAGVIVRGIVYPYTISHGSRVAVGVFSFPNGEATFFGAVAGVVIGFVSALVMLATRRPASAAGEGVPEDDYGYAGQTAYLPVEQPPPFDPPVPAGAAGYAAAGYGAASYDRPAYTGPGYAPVVAPSWGGGATDQTEALAASAAAGGAAGGGDTGASEGPGASESRTSAASSETQSADTGQTQAMPAHSESQADEPAERVEPSGRAEPAEPAEPSGPAEPSAHEPAGHDDETTQLPAADDGTTQLPPIDAQQPTADEHADEQRPQ